MTLFIKTKNPDIIQYTPITIRFTTEKIYIFSLLALSILCLSSKLF